MATWDGNNYYYSGQGVVLIGERDSLGKPKGLIPVGNVSELKISLAASVLEHKESQTGQRGIDVRLTTELKATLSMTMENFNHDNLTLALRGTQTQKTFGGTVTNEAPKLYWGRVVPLKYARVSALSLARPGPQALTAYTNEQTAYDYKINAEAGSVQMNDGQSIALTAGATTGGVTVTGTVTVGNPTILTVNNTAAAEDRVALGSFTGADAAVLNNKAFRIISATSTTITIDVDTTGKTITTGTSLASFDGQALDADYTYAQQNIVDALTAGSPERYLRFEGLNTADNNNPVVVEVFKFLVDPLKELSVIGDAIQQFVLEGNVLADPLQLTGSKYFKQTLIR